MFRRLLIAASLLLTSPVIADQSTYVIPSTGPESFTNVVINRLNPAYRALASCSSGTTAPANGPSGAALQYQCWFDTSTTPPTYRLYDSAQWVAVGTLNVSTHLWTAQLANNQVGNAQIRQAAALSVVGNAGSSTANVADIPGTANQIMRVNGGGSALGFGSIDLSQAAAVGTSMLGGVNGGTGNVFMQFAGPSSAMKTYTLPNASDTIATLAAAQTLSNKSVDTANGNSMLIAGVPLTGTSGNGNTVALTNGPTFVAPTLGAAVATSVNKVAITAPSTGSTLTIANGKTLIASSSLTLSGTDGTSFVYPPASDTLAGLAATQTLTNKTLTTPIIAQILNGAATLTLPTSTDTIVGRATTDTLSNKTIDTAAGNTVKINGNTLSASAGTATVTVQNATDTLVGRATTDTLTNKTIDTASGANTVRVNGNSVTAVTGTGGTIALSNGPTFISPTLGAATATTVNKVTVTQPANGSTLTLADGKTLAVGSSLGLLGTDGTSFVYPPASDTLVGLAATQTLTNKTFTSPAVNGATIVGGTIDTTAQYARNVSTGCGLSGGGNLSADRTLSLSLTVNAQTGTSYTVTAADCGKAIVFSNSSAVAVNLTGGLYGGWSADFQDNGTGTVTITPSSGTINGNSSLVLASKQGAHCFSDGTNYSCNLGVGSSGAGSGTMTSVVAGGSLTAQGGACGGTITTSGTIDLCNQTRANLTMDRIGIAKLIKSAQRGVGSFVDGFGDSSGINTGSTTFSVDTTNQRITNSGGTQSNTLYSSNGENANTFLTRDFQLQNGLTTATVGFYSTVAVTGKVKIFQRTGAGAYTEAAETIISHSGGGYQDFSLVYTLPSSGTYYAAIYSSAAFTMSTSSGGLTSYYTGEASGSTTGWTEAGGNNAPVMRVVYGPVAGTVLTNVQTADATVNTGRVSIVLDANSSPTWGAYGASGVTDTMELSCNGSSGTWTTLAMNLIGKVQAGATASPVPGGNLWESPETPCGASGTSFLARWRPTAVARSAYGLATVVHP